MRVFLDTNILLDYFAHRDPFFVSARKLLLFSYVREFETWVSASQITDVFYLLTTGPQKISQEEAKCALRKLRTFVHVCSIGEEEVDAALRSSWDDFEDACVLQAALKVKADAIVTRNKKDFFGSPLRVLDCEELFRFMEEERGLVYDEIDF